MKKGVLLSLCAGSILLAGGYKIPETSTNAVALGSANIAHNHSADAAYYNPANMVFMDDKHQIEVNVMHIGLDKVKYNGKVSGTGPYPLESEKESFVVPSLHYVSKPLGESGARVGVSIASPGGLSKRWKTEPAKTSAEEFTLKTVEINPTAAFKVSNTIGFAVGFRIVDSHGVVKSNGTAIVNPSPTLYSTVSRDMTGDGLDFGYNLALSYKPQKNLEFGVTYRSKINLQIDGHANLNATASTPLAIIPAGSYSGDSGVSIPLPATLAIAGAYTFPTKTTLEVVFERTYWSAYKSLDFTYPTPLAHPVLKAAFDDSKPKNWDDTTTWRFGLTQEFNRVTLMAGLVIDDTPVPESTLSFELPDTNTVAYSVGGRYKLNENWDIALAGLYSKHKNRNVTNSSLSGTFSGGDITLISAGVGYKF